MSELSSALLQVVLYEKRAPKRAMPLMMEFPVNPELAPFLVTSSKGTFWVKSHGGLVRAALRHVPEIQDYFLEVTRAVTIQGRKKEWGNVQPLTQTGLETATNHIKNYDLEDLEILAHPKFPWGSLDPEGDTKRSPVLVWYGLPVQPTIWLPMDTVLVLPKDRSFVGFALLFQERLVSVVHNASRGIGIATSWTP